MCCLFFRVKHFTDPYELPNIPQIQLENPSKVLEDALEEAKQSRLFYRARFIPINELFSQEELKDLLREFNAATHDKETLNLINLRAILYNLNFDQTGISDFDFFNLKRRRN